MQKKKKNKNAEPKKATANGSHKKLRMAEFIDLLWSMERIIYYKSICVGLAV